MRKSPNKKRFPVNRCKKIVRSVDALLWSAKIRYSDERNTYMVLNCINGYSHSIIKKNEFLGVIFLEPKKASLSKHILLHTKNL